jgi:GNAT superfamily N-acetyltransferase
MQDSLVFRLLPAPPTPKTLLVFRRNAGWNTLDPASIAEALVPRPGMQWVTVLQRHRTVAIARLELAPPQFCFVSDCIVDRSMRGRGVGSWLLGQVERECRERGIPRLLLRPTDESLGFYRKLGFTPDTAVAGFLRKDVGPVRRRLLPF